MRFFGSMKRKLLFWLLVIVIIPSGLTGFLGYKIGQNILEKYVYKQLSITAEGIRDRIDSFLKMKKERVVDFGSDGFIRDQTERIGNYGKAPTERGKADNLMTELSNYLAKNKVPLDVDILETFVMDMHGEIIASSKTQHITLKRPDADYFVSARKYGVYATDLHHCVETGEPVIEVSRLLTSREEDFKAIGVIVNRIKGSSLVDLFKRDVAEDSAILSESNLGKLEESKESQGIRASEALMMEDKGFMDLEFTKTPTLEQFSQI